MASHRPPSLKRLFHTALDGLAEGDECRLDDDALKHARILRLVDGDEVELFDGAGRTTLAQLKGKRACVGRIDVQPPPTSTINLILAFPKPKTVDDVIRMATELGVSRVIIAPSSRSPHPQLGKQTLARWTRIARQACRQSERAFLPRVEWAPSLNEAIASIPAAAERYVCWARGEETSEPTGRERWISVGPEGGFNDSELEGFERAGFAPLRLGRHILRVPTAVAAGLTLVARNLDS